MIKYTILYKNGKTWNGKAESLKDINPVDCLAMVVIEDCMIPRDFQPNGELVPAISVRVCTVRETGNKSFVWAFVDGVYKFKKRREPNPASVTKKQKAFDEAYAEWRTNKYSKPFPLGPGGADCSIKAYKKWLWEQKQAELKSVLKETSLDEFVKISFPSGASISWDTKGETVQSLVKKITGETGTNTSDGWIPWHGGECPVPNESRVEVQWRGGGTDDSLSAGEWNWKWVSPTGKFVIVAYRLLDEDGKPVKYSEPVAEFHKQVEGLKEHLRGIEDGKASVLCTQRTWDELGWSKQPIKTTYTFWLGAFGEIDW